MNNNHNTDVGNDIREYSSTKSKVIQTIKEWAIIPIAAIVTSVLFGVIFLIGVVPSGSMEPTIHSGSIFVGTRYTAPEDFQRGDKILFYHFSETFVKRVIGRPGDTVSFKDGDVYINGELYEEDYIPEGIPTVSITEEYIVPDECFFVLGDNREYSFDSRRWEYPFVRFAEVRARGILFVNIPWWDGNDE